MNQIPILNKDVKDSMFLDKDKALSNLAAAAMGRKPSDLDLVKSIAATLSQNPSTLVPLLGLLKFQNKAYSLKDHFPFEPIFRLSMPTRMIWKCGRQVAKSTSLSAGGVLRTAGTPNLRTLFVTPRYEQIRRLSSNYVRPFINQSLIKSLLVDESCTQHVLQRSFINQSTMFFSFAFLDTDRVRGIPCDIINIDEVQDIDTDFVPIIRSCSDASQLQIMFLSGTPKTVDNGIQTTWEESSQGEWAVPCHGCGYWNLACIDADLEKMIGLKTIVCAKCQKPVNPREGSWYHINAQNHKDTLGYHVPQIIMPMHYEHPQKWRDILVKREGGLNFSPSQFKNEILGESCDMGVKLVTKADIAQASLNDDKTPRPVNDLHKIIDLIRGCKIRALGVDWGGAGEEEVSFTTCALVGLDPLTNKCCCFYTHRFHSSFTPVEEAEQLMMLFREANCHLFCHDFGGSGNLREILMIQAGIPVNRIMNIQYVRATTKNMVTFHQATNNTSRHYWSLDKARSLVLQATCIKSGVIKLPEYKSSIEITEDLTNLIEDKHDVAGGADVYLIRRKPKCSDDFAHALNYACIGIWHTDDRYPDLSMLNQIKLTPEQLALASPPNPWSEEE